jgi:hypothetical protein
MPSRQYLTDPRATNIPWTESPFFPQLLQEAHLDGETSRLVEQYAKDGYLIIDPGIPAQTLDSVVRDLADSYHLNAGPSHSDEIRIADAWAFNEAVRSIALAPKVLALLETLYRRPPVPFQTLNFRVGTEQRAHSDTIHFNSVPERFMCGVWVALEDMDHSNGPLVYYPGSHKLPVYDLHDIGICGSDQRDTSEFYPLYEDFVQALIAAHGLERREINVKKGQALVWSANLFHGGAPILDRSRSRNSQVTHYYFSGCYYYTPLLSDVAIGKVSAREVCNLAIRQNAPQHYNGRLILNPGQWPFRLAAPE